MKLQKNSGNADRLIRLVIAAVLGTVALTGLVAAPWSYLALGLAAIMLATALTGFCPIYAIFGVSTCPRQKA
jgi:hypothetical protein